MEIESIHITGDPCFKEGWSGFDEFKKINIIIGRNNVGKSRLLRLVQQLAGKGVLEGHRRYSAAIDLSALNRALGSDPSRATKSLIGQKVIWRAAHPKSEILDPLPHAVGESRPPAIRSWCQEIVPHAQLPFAHAHLTQLDADRDIVPEPDISNLSVKSNGSGATNAIQLLLNDKHRDGSLVEDKLRSILNLIFGGEAEFTQIKVQRDGNNWEVFLTELEKGSIALADSGSGLKTVILVALQLLFALEKLATNNSLKLVFLFEELENNLHPGVFRRLLRYIERFSQEHNAYFFITTHSSVVLNMFGRSPDAQIIHVAHNGKTASTCTVTKNLDHTGVTRELGAQPADLLQANGIVWVEGPSDCVYLNKWIELVSEQQKQDDISRGVSSPRRSLSEGRDYQCAFYGGALLNRVSVNPEQSLDECLNLFQINPNIAVVCDSDRAQANDKLKPRVEKLKAGVEPIDHAVLWITEAREIENYIPGDATIDVLAGAPTPRSPEQYESFFPKDNETACYRNDFLKASEAKEKISLAQLTAPHMTFDSMKDRFDWFDRVTEIVNAIRKWGE